MKPPIYLLGQDNLLPSQKQPLALQKEAARITRAINLYAALVRDFTKNRQNSRFIERIDQLSALLGNYLSRLENLQSDQAVYRMEDLVVCYEWAVEVETIEEMTEKKEIKNLRLNAANELQINFQLSKLYSGCQVRLLSLEPQKVVFAYRTDKPGMPFLNLFQKRRLPLPARKEVEQ